MAKPLFCAKSWGPHYEQSINQSVLNELSGRAFHTREHGEGRGFFGRVELVSPDDL